MQIYGRLAAYPRFMLDVETRVRLEASLQIGPLERRGAEVRHVDTERVCHYGHQKGDEAVIFFVFGQWGHDLQYSLVEGQVRRTLIGKVSQQSLVGSPAHVVENDPFFRRTHQGYHRLRSQAIDSKVYLSTACLSTCAAPRSAHGRGPSLPVLMPSQARPRLSSSSRSASRLEAARCCRRSASRASKPRGRWVGG